MRQRLPSGRRIARAKSSAATNSPITINSPRPPYSIMPLAKNSRFISPWFVTIIRGVGIRARQRLGNKGQSTFLTPVKCPGRIPGTLWRGCIFSEACRCSFRFPFIRTRTRFSRRGISKNRRLNLRPANNCEPYVAQGSAGGCGADYK